MTLQHWKMKLQQLNEQMADPAIATDVAKLQGAFQKADCPAGNTGAAIENGKNSVRVLPIYFHPYYIRNYSTMTSVPAPIRIQPTMDFAVKSSCKNTNARISVSTTLNLSTGTTLDASPICSAL